RCPRLLGDAPLQAFKQHGHLRRRQSNRTFLGDRPREAALLQALGEQAEALAVPVQNLDQVTSAPPEGKQVARERVLLQHLLRQHRETVEAAAHVGYATRQIDAHAGRHRDHHAPPARAATTRESVAGSMLSSTLTTRPFESAISISPGRRRPTGVGRRCGTFRAAASSAPSATRTATKGDAAPLLTVTPGI